MTFAEYQALSRDIRARAGRIAKAITEQAREIGETKLGSGRDYAFACAHNWLGQAWMSPEQNKAARTILWLQSESFKPSSMADRILSRAWKKVA